MSNASVSVYNMGGKELLGKVSLHHAITMLHKQKAIVKEAVQGKTFGSYPLPKALELVRYIFAEWKYRVSGRVPFSKAGVKRRDGFRCAYCGKVFPAKQLTVDHILPKWQGNSASWSNSISACFADNNRKGGRSPKEAGMKLLFTPRVPTFAEAYKWTHGKD